MARSPLTSNAVSGAFVFIPTFVELMRIERVGGTTNSRVGINTTDPQNTLNVIGDGNFTGNLTIGFGKVETSNNARFLVNKIGGSIMGMRTAAANSIVWEEGTDLIFFTDTKASLLADTLGGISAKLRFYDSSNTWDFQENNIASGGIISNGVIQGTALSTTDYLGISSSHGVGVNTGNNANYGVNLYGWRDGYLADGIGGNIRFWRKNATSNVDVGWMYGGNPAYGNKILIGTNAPYGISIATAWIEPSSGNAYFNNLSVSTLAYHSPTLDLSSYGKSTDYLTPISTLINEDGTYNHNSDPEFLISEQIVTNAYSYIDNKTKEEVIVSEVRRNETDLIKEVLWLRDVSYEQQLMINDLTRRIEILETIK